ncbi:ABC transporter permease subunit [Streptomyces sp. R28]|uniref:ABC transporter permease subunit n=1 Tax=Streptomyces sp. R28 TaxID=3238628 RepID=A0AB39PS25_9ACTN
MASPSSASITARSVAIRPGHVRSSEAAAAWERWSTRRSAKWYRHDPPTTVPRHDRSPPSHQPLTYTLGRLQRVDQDVLDDARGMGMNRFHRLWQIELPMAWPVILAGLRVSAQLTVGIVTIAAFEVNMGLGYYGYTSLDNLGSVNTGTRRWCACSSSPS